MIERYFEIFRDFLHLSSYDKFLTGEELYVYFLCPYLCFVFLYNRKDRSSRSKNRIAILGGPRFSVGPCLSESAHARETSRLKYVSYKLSPRIIFNQLAHTI